MTGHMNSKTLRSRRHISFTGDVIVESLRMTSAAPTTWPSRNRYWPWWMWEGAGAGADVTGEELPDVGGAGKLSRRAMVATGSSVCAGNRCTSSATRASTTCFTGCPVAAMHARVRALTVQPRRCACHRSPQAAHTAAPVQITVIGARNMARGIATRARAGGHTVTVTAKDPAKAARLPGGLGAHARNPPTNTATDTATATATATA